MKILRYLILSGIFIACFCLKIDAQPNVLVICVDDVRFNDLGITGGPSFVSTPNIDRIGIEGVNFENSFVVYSKCKPSKGTMLTGLYPHTFAPAPGYFFDNGLSYNVKQAGYSTGFIGKHHWSKNPQPNYDFWAAFATFNPFINPTINVNGTSQVINGHLTDILTDFAVDFIDDYAQNPFFLFLSYKALHIPATPKPQHNGLLDSIDIPLPFLHPEALINKPSFVKPVCDNVDIPQLIDRKRDMYELMIGLDESIGVVLDSLESKGILDSTMIIFISDNGFMYGENRLAATKKWAYEQSMRIPMLARYPKLINPGTVVSDYALNLDLVQTIYDVIGLDSLQTQGISLLDFVNGTKKRKTFMYEFINNFAETGNPTSGQADVPTFRGIRTDQFKYIKYFCDQKTEELYDMQNDPNEYFNLIFAPQYDSIVNVLKYKLDSLRIAFDDTFAIDTLVCSILRYNQCCPTVTNLNVTPLGNYNYKLTWSPTDGASKYIVEVKKQYNLNPAVAEVLTNQLIIQSLKPNSQYDFRIKAICNDTLVNEAIWSVNDTFTTPPACIPSDSIYSTDITKTSVKLNWNPVPGALGYRIFGKRLGSSKIVILQLAATDTFRSILNLKANTTYIWAVKTTCDAGGSVSDFSMIDTFKTLNNAGFKFDSGDENSVFSGDYQFDFDIHPNPNNGKFNLDLFGIADSDIEVTITNLLGQVILNEKINLFNSQESLNFSLPEDVKGVLLVTVSSKEDYQVKKIIVE